VHTAESSTAKHFKYTTIIKNKQFFNSTLFLCNKIFRLQENYKVAAILKNRIPTVRVTISKGICDVVLETFLLVTLHSWNLYTRDVLFLAQ